MARRPLNPAERVALETLAERLPTNQRPRGAARTPDPAKVIALLYPNGVPQS